jgi:hypothetical protein
MLNMTIQIKENRLAHAHAAGFTHREALTVIP